MEIPVFDDRLLGFIHPHILYIYTYIYIYIYIYLFLYIPLYSHIRGFHKWGYPKIDGVFFMDHPIEMDPSQVSARGPCHG